MKQNYTAALLAALLLLGVSGCGSKPQTNVTTPPVTETFGETEVTAPDTDLSDASEESTDAAEESTADGTSATTATAAAAAAETPPAKLADGAPQPVTMSATVDVGELPTHPDNADDDQMGDEEVTAAAETQVSAIPDKPAVTAAPAATTAASASKLAVRGGAANGKLQVSVPTAEVTVDQLKKQDYTVDLVIKLDKNPGITYSEWGLNLDKRCTYTADSDGLPIETVSFINDQTHFLWTAWASTGNVMSRTGGMLTLHVTLPHDAKSGSSYPITYAESSLQPAPHIWQNGDSNWVSSKEVGWVSGGVVVK